MGKDIRTLHQHSQDLKKFQISVEVVPLTFSFTQQACAKSNKITSKALVLSEIIGKIGHKFDTDEERKQAAVDIFKVLRVLILVFSF
jgi:hypothetical protein